MPASIADPVASVLRTALSGKRAPFSPESEKGPELLEDRLAASAKRVLLSNIDYEPAPKQQVLALESLKSKYTVLNSTSNATKTKGKADIVIHFEQVIDCFCSCCNPNISSRYLAGSEGHAVQKRGCQNRLEELSSRWSWHDQYGKHMLHEFNTTGIFSSELDHWTIHLNCDHWQALFHVPSFANWLFNGRHCKNCDPNGTQLCLVCIIAKTLQTTHDKSGNIVKPILVYNRLKLICKHMVHGRQEDAHEFMRYLIESLEKSYLHSVGGMKLDSRSKETNPLGQIFGGYIRTEVTCLKCKHTSTTFQHFQVYQ